MHIFTHTHTHTNTHTHTHISQVEPGIRFDAVSCQFAIHYSWTSHEDALNALRNAAIRLKPGVREHIL